MIVEFRFKNYRSYRDYAEFSFEAQPSNFNSESITSLTLADGSIIRLLNVAAIFGANASGKSNIIHAISDLSTWVRESLRFNQNQPIPLRIPYGLNLKDQNLPTEFCIDFILKNQRYRYSLIIDDFGVKDEDLSEIRKTKALNIFGRTRLDNGEFGLKIGEAWKTSSLLLNDISLLPNQLLLSWLATKETHGLQDISDYLANLRIVSPDQLLPFGRLFNQTAETMFDGGRSDIYIYNLINFYK